MNAVKLATSPPIGGYRRAIFPGKDLVGEVGFQGFILCLMDHIGGKQRNPPCTALAGGLHHGNGNIHRRRHNPLTHFLGFEEPTVTEYLVDLYPLLFKEDIQSDFSVPSAENKCARMKFER